MSREPGDESVNERQDEAADSGNAMPGIKKQVQAALSRDAPPHIQFIKYVIAGGLATGVDILIFYFLAWKLIPALTPDDPVVRLLRLDGPFVSEALQGRNYVLCRVITFLFSNFTAYVLNFMWVFTPGRHKKHIEVMLFYMVSIISLALGTFIGWLLIEWAGFTTTTSLLGNIIAALGINFLCRKYIVFNR